MRSPLSIEAIFLMFPVIPIVLLVRVRSLMKLSRAMIPRLAPIETLASPTPLRLISVVPIPVATVSLLTKPLIPPTESLIPRFVSLPAARVPPLVQVELAVMVEANTIVSRAPETPSSATATDPPSHARLQPEFGNMRPYRRTGRDPISHRS